MEGDGTVEGRLGEKWDPVKFALLDRAGAVDVRASSFFAQYSTDSGVHERHVVRGIRRGASDDLVPARLRVP